MTTLAQIEGRTLGSLADLLSSADLPDGLVEPLQSFDELLQKIFICDPALDTSRGGLRFDSTLVVDDELVLAIPGLDAVKLVIGGIGGLTVLDVRAAFEDADPAGARFSLAIDDVPLTLRIDAEILHPVKPNSDDPDPDATSLDITCGNISLEVTERGLGLDIDLDLQIPRCMIGSSGIILSVGSARWITPESENPPPQTPDGFTGLFFDGAKIKFTALGIGDVTMDDVFIGTSGFSGKIALPDLSLTWNPKGGPDGDGAFEGSVVADISGFRGGLTKIAVEFRQSALFGCDIAGCVFVPYLDRVIGLDIGFDGNGGFTAIAQPPTCKYTDEDASAAAAGAAKPGYILSADIKDVFEFDVSRIEFQAGGAAPASLSLAGRVKLVVTDFGLPAVEFKGLKIDSKGHVAIEGGWLDVDQAKSGPLSGFPLQITKIGFGVETDGSAWVGLNGGIKLHDMLPVGASVDGLKVSWKATATGTSVNFSLDGIGVELAVEGTFSFVGKASFFHTDEASGFRGEIKLTLDSVGLAIDVGIMVGRMADGTFFFYLFIDVDLPVGIPLFDTGAALYGFAGLLAVNLQPARAESEHWYYGYYKRPSVGVTAPEKWAVKRDAFAIGAGTTIGSLPDTGYAISAKVLLILSLPGPRILLTGKGSFIEKKPENKDQTKEGTFEALLVLDTPSKLFQANLAITFKMGSLLEVAGGVDAAFSWADQPPADLWHVYVGEKDPEERRVHAKLLEFLKGDTWLMINRPGYAGSADATTKKRIGDFEIGGSLTIGADYNFTVVKAWLHASVFAQAAVTWEPQQIMADAELKGSAGIAALGMELSAELAAQASAKASKPLYFGASVDVDVRVNLIFYKWEFHQQLSIEYTRPDLPDYVTDFVAIKADHLKASEARDIDLPVVVPPDFRPAVVPADFRPVIIFSKPVRDCAWFGAPGDPDLPVEDLHVRQVSYQLRHIVLLANDATLDAPKFRLVGAAGQAAVTGTTIEFIGLDAADDQLPDIAGAEIRLFNIGDTTGQLFTVSTGAGKTATVTGSPPQGQLCYRVSAPLAQANVIVSGVADAGFGQLTATLAAPLADPQRFRGGSLTSGATQWLVMDAAATSLRLQAAAGVGPPAGAAIVKGPDPALVSAAWQAAGDPVESAGSSTRLQVWARTPYAMFRYNELDTISGLDAFDLHYACGPTPSEQPVCTEFADVPVGALAAAFQTAGIAATNSGSAAVVQASGGAHALALTRTTLAFAFDPPADAVWVTASRRELGILRAFKGGAKVGEVTVAIHPSRYRFDGGIDRIEFQGQDATLVELCFTPGWTCVGFEDTFPKNSTGEVTYAGVKFGSAGKMSVSAAVLHVVPATRPSRVTASSGRVFPAAGPGPGASAPIPVLEVPSLEKAFVAQAPILGDVQFVPGMMALAKRRAPPLRAHTLPASVQPSPARTAIETGAIRVHGILKPMVTLVVEFPRPATRARVTLGQCQATLVALAGTLQAATATAGPGETAALFADPSQTGWFNRVVITAAGEIELGEICTDRGDFGWARYQQWTWRQGVQRSVESLYEQDAILPPGNYELRAHTAAVVTGEQPTTETFTARAPFTVGAPPGFPAALANPDPPEADPRSWTYPYGGPLTGLATYVDRTMPQAGARLWYRALDTAVGFNETYVTRMYLAADEELRVSVLNSSDVSLRQATRHVWATGSAGLDATTSLYVRTLAGDGTDTCASVDVSQIPLPEAVTAGAGELLDASSLHRSQLRTRGSDTVVHEFQFTTSSYASFLHLASTFDGGCARLQPVAQDTPWDPRAKGQARLDALAQLETARAQAVATIASGRSASATKAQMEAASSAAGQLATARAAATGAAAADFDDIWSKCFGAAQPLTPDSLRISVVRAGSPNACDLLLLESPEPLAWDRLGASIASAADTPLTSLEITLATSFGRPDQGFDVAYGGLQWHAGVELWFNDGALRARADVPFDVTILFPRSTSADVVVAADAPAQVQASCAPPGAQVTVTAGTAPGTCRLAARAPSGSNLNSVRIQGAGIGIISCSEKTPFRAAPPTGSLRMIDVTLPSSASDLTHQVTLLAMSPVSPNGWSVWWVDPHTGGGAQLYAACTVDVQLAESQRVCLMPSLASAPSTDDALVLAGGPGTAPAPSGAVFQLFDPSGRCVQQRAAMPVGQGIPLAIIPNADCSRAFLIPPVAADDLAPGFWLLSLAFTGNVNAPDLDRWTIGGQPISQVARLPLLLEDGILP